MLTRRHFLQNAAFLAGAVGMPNGLLESIQRAAAIEPEQGSSYLDAEHVVILMQENRSFDHMYGSLNGVRGFNDPRAIRLPDGNPVWMQSNREGDRHVPFHLDMKLSKITWMGSLPHSWSDQTDAANLGLHDRWLETKRSGNKAYAKLPLTMGYFAREDIPFYYALADAFTICDQHFCSTLTGTTPNRLHLWTGTVRAKPDSSSPALVRNEDCRYGVWCDWKTFPERLEERSIPWKIYQNELSVPTSLPEGAGAWVANFGCNPIEWFTQYHVRSHPGYLSYLDAKIAAWTAAQAKLSKQLASASPAEKEKVTAKLNRSQSALAALNKEREMFSEEAFNRLPEQQQNIHRRAFTTNIGDPHYRDVTDLTYDHEGQQQTLKVPKGDVLYQFRKDVAEGTLPKVSWIVPPQNFSDHPSAAWYGQWYLSEVLNILTQKPEVWKKTIFILTYDENDGYYDHVPPFQAPNPKDPESGRSSAGLDTTLDYVQLEEDRQHKPNGAVRGNSMGLGYRVPMVVASPWSRGGAVCSQVFDHTSVLQFLEKFLSEQTGQEIREENITPWRRAVCGDLTSIFQSTADHDPGLKSFLDRNQFIGQIHRARFQDLPSGYDALTDAEAEQVRNHAENSRLPRQESGASRPACPLPYELAVEGQLNAAGTHFEIRFDAKNQRFSDRSAGAPFILYAETAEGLKVRHYTVEAGRHVQEMWPLADFKGGQYQLRVYGPNGFFREFRGTATTQLETEWREFSKRALGNSLQTGMVTTAGPLAVPCTFIFRDMMPGHRNRDLQMAPFVRAENRISLFNLEQTDGWYDIEVTSEQHSQFYRRYAGHVETGLWSRTDPALSSENHVTA